MTIKRIDSKDDELPDLLAALNVRERRFVEAFAGAADGNATRACELAGYRGSIHTLGVMGSQIAKRPRVREAIQCLLDNDPLVPTRVERLRFLGRVMRGQEMDTKVLADGSVIKIPAHLRDKIQACVRLCELGGDFKEELKSMMDQLPPNLTIEELFAIVGAQRPRPVEVPS